MMKKRKGSMVDVLPVCISILATAIVMFSYLSIIQMVEIDEQIDQLARKYILEMETVGYLQPSSVVALTAELTNAGATDIDFSGTTMSDAGYGNPIYLYISCSIPYSKLETVGGFFDFHFEDNTFSITAKKMSTAKN